MAEAREGRDLSLRENELHYVVIQFVLFAALFYSCAVAGGARLFARSASVIALVVILAAAGLVIALAAFAAIGSAFRVGPEPRAGARLVRRGIYRRLRHPMYTSVVLSVLALFLLKGTALAGATATLLILFYLIKTRHEERLLGERYEDYAEYRLQTWGVIPGLPPRRAGLTKSSSKTSSPGPGPVRRST